MKPESDVINDFNESGVSGDFNNDAVDDGKDDVVDVIDVVLTDVTVSNDVRSNEESYAQVTAHFVHFQKDGKKPDIEIMQSKNHEQKINMKNERDDIYVINVNNKDWNARSDKSSQNLQEIDTLLETNPDNNTVNNNDELKPTMHPGGIS